MNEQKISRIPRPKGATMLARSGQSKELVEKISEAFIQGSFPLNGQHLNMYQFCELYGIPVKTMERRITHVMSDSILDGEDLAGQLESERLKAFSQALYRIGVSDLETNRLASYLSGRVLSNPAAHPLLIKELNTIVSNRIKLTETQLKTILMINQSLSVILPGATQEKDLTREEILKEIAEMKMDKKLLEAEIEGTPDLAPYNLAETQSRENLNRKAKHDYDPLKDKENLLPIPHITVTPK